VDGIIAEKLQQKAEELIKEFCVKADKERKNELRIEVRRSLRGIAERIDRGFHIEVTAELPDGLPEEEAPEEAEKCAAYVRIQNAAEGMRFIKLEGDPILKLTGASEGAAKDSDSAKKHS
jgi:hypothetical protein